MVVTDLTGYTWVANEDVSPAMWFSPKQIDFISNNTTFHSLIMNLAIDDFIQYDSIQVCYYGNWADEAYKTIQITGGEGVTDTSIISWLEANGTLTLTPQDPRKTIYGRISQLHYTQSEWATLNPTLFNGEIGIESNTRKFKIGNGVSPWNNLDYFSTTEYASDEEVEEVFYPPVKLPVGGIIFYIDNTASGTYQFFDASGNPVSAPTVGTDCTGWTYTVSGYDKEKFYVYSEDAMYNYTNLGNKYVKWSAGSEDLTGVMEIPTGGSGTYTNPNGTVIGKGKVNTNYIRTNKNKSTYYPANSSYKTIWELARDCTVNGCSDWFVPNMAELGKIRARYGSNRSQWESKCIGVTGSVYTWCSSPYSESSYAWGWDSRSSYSDEYWRYGTRTDQHNRNCVVLSRSF